MGTVVLDAGIVIGWLETSDAHHAAADAAIDQHADDDVRIPSSVYAEILVRPARRCATELTRNLLRDVGIRIDAIGEETAEHAAKLRAAHPSLRLPDALVLGYAEVIDADVVLTTDRRWKRVSDRVHVV